MHNSITGCVMCIMTFFPEVDLALVLLFMLSMYVHYEEKLLILRLYSCFLINLSTVLLPPPSSYLSHVHTHYVITTEQKVEETFPL